MAIDGSFCRCRKGSPPGHFVPDTMLTLGPGVGVCAELGAPAIEIAKRNAMKSILRSRMVPPPGMARADKHGPTLRSLLGQAGGRSAQRGATAPDRSGSRVRRLRHHNTPPTVMRASTQRASANLFLFSRRARAGAR